MAQGNEFLVNIRRILKVDEEMMKIIGGKFQLSLIEVKIIVFLKNNPDRDTAADIAELRMLSKGNVSTAVESLIQKSLLQRTADAADRRKIHLSLLPEAVPVADAMDELREEFREELFYGFTQEEREMLESLNCRLMENSRNIVERRKEHE